MPSLPVYVGLDYHPSFIQACVLDQAGRVQTNRRCENNLQSLSEVIRPGWDLRGVAIEACCGAADLAEALVDQAGWPVSLAHAGYVAKLKGSPDKTDNSDAKLLADLTRVGYLPHVWLPPLKIRLLRQLINHRQRLVDQRRATKLRLGALLREHRIEMPESVRRSRWSRAWVQALLEQPWPVATRFIVEDLLEELTSLQRRVRSAERTLRESTAEDAVVHKLLAQEGVGPVTAWSLRAAIGDFSRFKSGKKLARYCGLSPKNASSGQRQSDGGLIHAANRRLRAVLIQAGQRLVRSSGRWGDLGRRLLEQGKPWNVVVAAVTNRWLRRLHHTMNGSEGS